ncbi:MAG: photosynthetic complex putative assembly protein PuhB [Parvularculaceae bacterium]
MDLFHDEEDVAGEPVLGLPETLPQGERVIWRGRPNALALAVDAFRLPWIAAYFAIATAWRIVGGLAAGEGAQAATDAAIMAFGMFCLAAAVIIVLAAAMARATVYTVTNRRVVIRHGAAIRKYVNLPFAMISAASLQLRRGGVGNLALALNHDPKRGAIPYLHLWPHARPFRFARTQPTFRAIPQAEDAARAFADAMKANAPARVSLDAPSPQPDAGAPDGREQVAVA